MEDRSRSFGQGDSFSPNVFGKRVRPGIDPELMRSIHTLRYEVYCRECRFLPEDDYPDGREADEYDSRSAHFCALGNEGNLMGYARLVHGGEDGVFPFQKVMAQAGRPVDRRLPGPAECAEISRLMVCPSHRRRKGDTAAGVATVHPGAAADAARERRTDSSKALLCLYRQMYRYSLEAGIRYWYAAMERSLARSLRRLDFAFEKIGPETDYYGPVAPHMADLRELEARLSGGNPALWDWLQREGDF